MLFTLKVIVLYCMILTISVIEFTEIAKTYDQNSIVLIDLSLIFLLRLRSSGRRRHGAHSFILPCSRNLVVGKAHNSTSNRAAQSSAHLHCAD